MKKRILLMLFVISMLACLLAISVSAAEPDTTKETVTLSDGKVCPLWDTDGNPLIWYVTATDADTGVKTYAYVDATSESVDYNGGYSDKTDGVTWYQLTNVTITVDGTSYNKSSIAVFNIRSDDVKITSGSNIGQHVTCISKLFTNSTNLEYVYLPVDIVDINNENFKNCKALKYVNLSELTNLREISLQDFNGCVNLFAGQVLDLSNTKICALGDGALATIPVTEIKLPSTLLKVGSWVFQGTAITRIDLPESITSFGDNSQFKQCSNLETITGYKRLIDNKIVKQIGSYQFSECKMLYNVDGLITNGVLIIPEGFTRIDGQLSFNECDRLVYVEFPSTITYVGQAAFSYCDNLKLVSFDKVDAKIKNAIANGETYTKVSFNNCGTFKGCKKLVALSVPEGTTEIINRFVAQGCTSLTAFYMPNTVSYFGTNSNAQGPFCDATSLYFVQESFTVGQCLVNGEVDLTRLVLPEKPSVYYMPTSLSYFTGHTQENQYSKGGTIFRNCNSINDTIVFGEYFTYMNAYNAFQNIGSTSAKNVVFLADMTGFVTTQNTKNVSFIFANKADKSPNDIGIVQVYQDSNNSNSFMYFCYDGSKYNYCISKNNLNADVSVNIATIVATGTTESKHLVNPKATVTTEPDCVTNAFEKTYCFCGAEYSSTELEGTKLDHDYVGVVTEPTCQNGGYTTYTCSVCKDTYTDNKTDAVDHKWNGASCEFNCGATREAYIGNVSYTTLADAIAKANAGDTIVLVADITSSEIIIIDKAITLDLNNSTVTSTAKKVFEVYADVTIKNGTIEGANRCVDTRKAVKLTLDTVALVADKYSSQYGNQQPLTIGGSENGTAVTMNNVTINAGTQGYAIISFVKTELTVNNSDVSGYIALYVKEGSENSTFSFVNSDLTSDITGNDVAGNATAAIKIEASNVSVNLDKDSTLTTNGAYAYAVSINDISSVVVSLPEVYKDALINSGYAVKDNGDGTITAECAHANATVTGYTYASGYNKIGVKVSVCECGETIEEKADALFEAIGYSVPDDGSGEIAVSFKVNGKAIAEFTSVTGKTVSYGVFAVLEERIGENSIFGDNGEIADGVICEELTGYGFTSFDLRITGLETDEYKATAIAMGAYAAISDGEATEYSCMQYGEPEQGASYEFVSYNDVKNNTSQAVNGGV